MSVGGCSDSQPVCAALFTWLLRDYKDYLIAQMGKRDSIVVSAGMRAKTDEALASCGTAFVFYMIGDCQRAATVLECNRVAFAVAPGQSFA